MHELLRQYAAEKLAAATRTAERPCATATAPTMQLPWRAGQRNLTGARQAIALEEMQAEIEDVLAAWEWAVEQGDAASLNRGMEGLRLFYRYHGYAPDWSPFEIGSARVGGGHQVGTCAAGAGPGAAIPGISADAGLGRSFGPLVREGLALLDEPELAGQDTRRERALALMLLGAEARDNDRPDEARRLFEESLALYEAVGDRHGMGEVLPGFGGAVAEHRSARRSGEDVRGQPGHWAGDGQRRACCVSLGWLVRLALQKGQPDRAEQLLRERLRVHPPGTAGGRLWMISGCPSRARQVHPSAPAFHRDPGHASKTGAAGGRLTFVPACATREVPPRPLRGGTRPRQTPH